MADIWTGATISLVSIGVAAGIAELRELWKERKTKHRVAIALTTEILAMADMVAECASLANLAEFGLKGALLNRGMIEARLPPEPTAYRALAGQLPLLDINTVSAVVAFFGSLDVAKRLSSQYKDDTTIPEGHAPTLGNAWRATARCALIAMQRIGRYNPPVTHKNDVAQLTELTSELADVVSNKWPRIEQNPKTGGLQIGRASLRKRS